MGVRTDRLAVLRAAANKKYGHGTIELAGRMKPLPVPRLTTGSLSFDYALGGGLPVGHVTIFRGSESSGKTTAATRIGGLAQDLCANCLRRPEGGIEVEEQVDEETGEVVRVAHATCDCARTGLFRPRQIEGEDGNEFRARAKRYQDNSYEEFRVAYLDVEGTFDDAWALQLGCDSSRMVKVRTATAEETIDLHDELVRTGAVDLLVIDSLAAMTPSTEVEASSVEWQQGLQPRLLNKFSRKVTAARQTVRSGFGRPVTEIWINQERKKIGVSYGDDTIMPGGEGQKFTASVIAKFWASKWERETVDEALKKEWQLEAGTDVQLNFKIIKNKTARAMVQGGYRMGVAGDQAGAVLDLDYMVAQAEKFGLLRKDGAAWLLGDEKHKTKAAATDRIAEPALRRALRAQLVGLMIAAG